MSAGTSPSVAALRAQASKLERAGDLAGALEAYEAAAAQAPDDVELLAALARLAGRLDLNDLAAAFWGRVMVAAPDSLEAVDGCARALGALGRLGEAVELLRSTLLAQPQEPRLWTSLGVMLTNQGRAELALTFFDEAARLDDRSPATLNNRAQALCDLGRFEAAEADFRAARKLARKPTDAAVVDFALATLALTRGDLGEGWRLYERRLSPDWPKSVVFEAHGRRWSPPSPLLGRNLLVFGEQGLGDEIMFANVLPDVVDALGPDGRLRLAVAPRLVDLFQRSFPNAEVRAHATERVGLRVRRSVADTWDGRVDLWCPMGSLPLVFRRTPEDFPSAPYLRPDPARVRHWRDWLGACRPSVGITWRSGKITGERQRFYPPLGDWAAMLRTPGVSFVNLQYGECAEDLRVLAEMSGVEIRQPPGLDIKDDIDDLAALCVALDLVVAVQNATGALAGACGAPLVMLAAPGSWTQLGSDRLPWYPGARVCIPPSFEDWRSATAKAAAAVATLCECRSLV